MALANRVQPDGSFATLPTRGAFMGNRGRLHDAAGGIGARRWAGRAWITCTLHPKPGRALPGVTPPNGYTRLFFLDEAVACAAGHRPCAECRRAAYQAFREAWARAFGAQASARDMDAVLHDARIVARSRVQRQHSALAESLPDGAFILWDGLPCRIGAAELHPYRGGAYLPTTARPLGPVRVLTPAPLVAVMAAGWHPALTAEDDRPNW